MTDITDKRPEEEFPPALWTPLTEADIAVLRRQNKGRRFDASLVYAVAARCSRGCPQVTVCYPAARGGKPFPTLFWLTCPHLSRVCGLLESNQMVSELESIFAEIASEVEAWHERYAALRACLLKEQSDRLTEAEILSVSKLTDGYGVGGINWRAMPSAAKCMHLQTATMLGLGSHPAEEWLRTELGVMECDCAPCLNVTAPDAC